MLSGIDPIIIFQFSKLTSEPGSLLSKIPVISKIPTVVEQPPIPIYLSEELTGIYIDSEDKNVDIDTNTETLSSGESPETTQKGVGSTVSINLVAKKDSVGMSLLSAMIDLVFDKVTSREYSITYLHGATTIFRAVLHSFSVNQSATNDLLTIKIELSRGTKTPEKKAETPITPKLDNVQQLG